MVFKRTSNIAFYFPSFSFRVEIEGSSSAATVQSVSLLLLILKVKPVMMQNHWDCTTHLRLLGVVSTI